MSQIPDAFKGHDLTGWAWIGNPCKEIRHPGILRLCADGTRIVISETYPGKTEGRKKFDCHVVRNDGWWGEGFGALSTMLQRAGELSARHGGWAPAPIGYVLAPEVAP